MSGIEPATPDEITGRVHLPLTEFMYTLDQVAGLLNVQITGLQHHVRFMGVNRVQPNPKGSDQKDIRMKAVSILPTHLHKEREWRIPRSEVERYLKDLGLVIYERKYKS